MLFTLSTIPARLLAQDAPPVSPWLLAIIAILLIAAFIWLLLRWQYQQPEADRAVKAAAEPEKVYMPVVPNEAAAVPASEAPAMAESDLAEPAVVEPAMEAVRSYSIPEQPAAAVPPQVIDDLEIIEGIGPKIAAVLKQAGVTSFNQLAAMEPARISEILLAANLRLADPQSWPEQARLAAAGDKAGLQALQDRLKGGRLQ